MSNQTDVFMQAIGAINARLAEIQQRVDDHFNVDPDRLDWTHAETAKAIADELHRVRLMANQLSGIK